jgi:hypothetical protein
MQGNLQAMQQQQPISTSSSSRRCCGRQWVDLLLVVA